MRLLHADIAQPESRQPSVQDIGRVMHMPVPHQIKRRAQLTVPSSPPLLAAHQSIIALVYL